MCPFDYIAVAVSGKVAIPLIGFYRTSLVAVVTPTDRPKSVRNCCLIEVFGYVFGDVFVLSRYILDFSFGVGVFVIGLSQVSSFFYWCHGERVGNHFKFFRCVQLAATFSNQFDDSLCRFSLAVTRSINVNKRLSIFCVLQVLLSLRVQLAKFGHQLFQGKFTFILQALSWIHCPECKQKSHWPILKHCYNFNLMQCPLWTSIYRYLTTWYKSVRDANSLIYDIDNNAVDGAVLCTSPFKAHAVIVTTAIAIIVGFELRSKIRHPIQH